MRRIAGVGVNVTEVYKDARSYLKGSFNAIEAFHLNRDSNGWRLQKESLGPLADLDDPYGIFLLHLEDAMCSPERLEIEDAPHE